MFLLPKIDSFDLSFFIISFLIIIAKLIAIAINHSNLAQNQFKPLKLLSSQPYKLAGLVLLTFGIDLFILNKNELFINHLNIINFLIILLRFILIIAIVLKEENIIFLYFKDNVNFSNKTLRAILPLIWHSIRLSLVLIVLLVLFPIDVFPHNAQYYINKLLNIFIIWSISWLIIQLVISFEKISLNKFGTLEMNNFQARSNHTRVQILKRLMISVIIVVTLACTFMVFDKIKTLGTSIFASAGIITAIIGFSAQKTIGNLIVGIQIAINEPIKINDIIVIENEYGTVEEISFTYAVVKIWDLRRLIVPISYFTEQPFVNLSRSSTNVLCPIIFYADYSLPIEKVRDYFIETIRTSPLWDGQVARFSIVDATEQTIKVRALASARTADDSATLKYEMFEKLIKFINDNFPQSLPNRRISVNTLNNSHSDNSKLV